MNPKTFLLLGALLAVVAAASPAPVVSVPRYTHPGAVQTFCFVLTDRFVNGTTANDCAELAGGAEVDTPTAPSAAALPRCRGQPIDLGALAYNGPGDANAFPAHSVAHSFACRPVVPAGGGAMLEIFQHRLRDVGIDGYRVGTMKHVNAERQGAFSGVGFGRIFDSRP